MPDASKTSLVDHLPCGCSFGTGYLSDGRTAFVWDPSPACEKDPCEAYRYAIEERKRQGKPLILIPRRPGL